MDDAETGLDTPGDSPLTARARSTPVVPSAFLNDHASDDNSSLVLPSRGVANRTILDASIAAGNYDDVTLVQIGDRVTGTYVCCGGGTIEGQIQGRILHFRWKQPSGWGSGVWAIEPGHLDGTWGNNQDEVTGGRWDLVQVKPAQKIAN